KKPMANRRFIGYFIFHRVCFCRTNYNILNFFLKLVVIHLNFASNAYFVVAYFLIVYNLGVSKHLFKECYSGLNFSLFFLSGIVLGVFRKVALASCLFNFLSYLFT